MGFGKFHKIRPYIKIKPVMVDGIRPVEPIVLKRASQTYQTYQPYQMINKS